MASELSQQMKHWQCCFTWLITAVIGLASHQLAAQENTEPFTFAVVGDVPYGDEALSRFPELVASIESFPTKFVIHIGDIKGGSATCSDEMISSRIQAIDAIKKPVIYTPGDNDWTDCHRRGAGRFAPLERLAFLRQQAFPVTGQSLGQPKMRVQSQASETGFEEFPEHQRWTQHSTAFIALHVLGSANGFEGFSGRTEADDSEVKRRISASIAWLRSNMEQAIASQASSIVVAIHGNPLDLAEARAVRFDVHPFAGVMTELKQQAVAFGKPVLLIHGDTHRYRFDQPFSQPDSDAVLTNLYRLEGIGDPAIGWVEVQVDANGPQVFRVVPHFITQ